MYGNVCCVYRREAGASLSLALSAEKKQLRSRRVELLLAGCLYYSGLVRFARWWIRRSGPTLTVLCYHRASAGYLREHMRYLKRHYRLLHLETALEELYAGRKGQCVQTDRRPMLVLTFDDGYHDLLTHGLPLASELQIPLTGFLIPGYIETGQRFWWLEPEYLVSHAQVGKAILRDKTYHLSNQTERQELVEAIEAGLRYASSIAERDAFLEMVRAVLGVPISVERNGQTGDLSVLNWSEVREIERSSWISFGAHTMHHPILAYLTNEPDLHYELEECRGHLEKKTGHLFRTFAYPVGKDEHIGEKVRAATEKAGYSWAVTAIHGLNTPDTDPYYLYRIVVDVDQHWLMVAAKASGLWDVLVRAGQAPLTLLRNLARRTLRKLA